MPFEKVKQDMVRYHTLVRRTVEGSSLNTYSRPLERRHLRSRKIYYLRQTRVLIALITSILSCGLPVCYLISQTYLAG